MIRVIIGAVPAALAMFVIGFIFFGTPLAKLGTASLDNAKAATVQQALAASIPATGTYAVPDVQTREQTNMYSRGPIATIHYNSRGFAAMDAGALLGGLVMNFVVALLIGAALIGIDRRVPDFGSRARGRHPRRRRGHLHAPWRADLLPPRLAPLPLPVRRRCDRADRRRADHRAVVPAQGRQRAGARDAALSAGPSFR